MGNARWSVLRGDVGGGHGREGRGREGEHWAREANRCQGVSRKRGLAGGVEKGVVGKGVTKRAGSSTKGEDSPLRSIPAGTTRAATGPPQGPRSSRSRSPPSTRRLTRCSRTARAGSSAWCRTQRCRPAPWLEGSVRMSEEGVNRQGHRGCRKQLDPGQEGICVRGREAWRATCGAGTPYAQCPCQSQCRRCPPRETAAPGQREGPWRTRWRS